MCCSSHAEQGSVELVAEKIGVIIKIEFIIKVNAQEFVRPSVGSIMIAVITFKRYNEIGVSTQGFIIIINNIFALHVHSFAFVMKDNVLRFVNVDHHLIGPKPQSNLL